jgi:hypothetical protein
MREKKAATTSVWTAFLQHCPTRRVQAARAQQRAIDENPFLSAFDPM